MHLPRSEYVIWSNRMLTEIKHIQTSTKNHTFEHIHLVQKMSCVQQNVYEFLNNVQNLCLKEITFGNGLSQWPLSDT